MKVDSITSPIKLQSYSCENFRFKLVQEEQLDSLMKEVTSLSSKCLQKRRSEAVSPQDKAASAIVADALKSGLTALLSCESLRDTAKRCIESINAAEANYVSDAMTSFFRSIERLEMDLIRQQQTAQSSKAEMETTQRNYRELASQTADMIRTGKSLTSIECDNPVNLYIRKNELKSLIGQTERLLQAQHHASHEAKSQKTAQAASSSKEATRLEQPPIRPPLKDATNAADDLKCIRCGLTGDGLTNECVYDSLCARTDENNMVSLVRVTQRAESHKFK